MCYSVPFSKLKPYCEVGWGLLNSVFARSFRPDRMLRDKGMDASRYQIAVLVVGPPIYP